MNRKYFQVLCFVLIAVFLFSSSVFCEVVFRFDDYPSLDPDLLELQNKIILTFKEKDIPLSIAVIPSRLKDLPEASDFLKNTSSSSIEIALHGWDHSNLAGGKSYNNASEYAGVPYEDQLIRIQKGVDTFESILLIKPEIFVPPYNTYDLNTVKILRASGFKTISANIRQQKIDYGNLNVVPETCLLSDINKIIKFGDKLYVVMFHEFDFKESKGSNAYFTLDQLDELLDKLKTREDIKFYNISSLIKQNHMAFTGDRVNYASEILNYRGTPIFYFPSHWVMKLPEYYGTMDFYKRLNIKTKINGYILDICFFFITIISAVFVVKALNIFRNKPFGKFIFNGLKILFIISVLILIVHGIIKARQGKSSFAYKYRSPMAISTALLIGMFWKKKI